MLNNDHFQDDFEEAAPPSFDASITVHIPSDGAAAYAKALAAVKEHAHLAWIETLPHDLRRIKLDGCTIALDQERQADKPGTIRKPGIRRLTTKNQRKPRWASR